MNPKTPDTTLARRMSALDILYARVRLAQTGFRASAAEKGSPLSCPADCGSCCSRFVPEVLPIEADKIAHFLLAGKPGLIDRLRAGEGVAEAACPFWNPDKPGENCMIYHVRPLICRLFGFSSVLDKCGEPTFSLCRQMPPVAGSPKRLFVGVSAMEELFGSAPPLMIDFSREIIALDPGEAGRRTGLREALGSSLPKVSLLLKLSSTEPERDEDPDRTDDLMRAG